MENVQLKRYSVYREDEILALYKAMGWKNYYENPQMLKESYEHSLYILGAYAGEKLIGIIRVVGDGHSIIYIQDILVLLEHQRKGIGRQLLQRVLEKYSNVYQKVLLTDNQPKTVPFYESMGFWTADKLGCVGFVCYTV